MIVYAEINLAVCISVGDFTRLSFLFLWKNVNQIVFVATLCFTNSKFLRKSAQWGNAKLGVETKRNAEFCQSRESARWVR